MNESDDDGLEAVELSFNDTNRSGSQPAKEVLVDLREGGELPSGACEVVGGDPTYVEDEITGNKALSIPQVCSRTRVGHRLPLQSSELPDSPRPPSSVRPTISHPPRAHALDHDACTQRG
jgi:hypothetical protein